MAGITRDDIRITTTPASYHANVGDTVTFDVQLQRHGAPVAGETLAYELSWDTIERIDSGTFTVADQPKRLSVVASKPGFVRLWVFAPGTRDQRDTRGESGVAVEPLKIVPRQTMPEDFNDFWQCKRELVLATPMYPHLTPIDSGIDGFETFDLQINAPGGLNCSGYFGRPANATPATLPAILFIHASGVYSSWLSVACKGHAFNALAYDLNVHGVPNGRERAYYEALAEGPLKHYHGFGQDDRETSYYLGMLMRVMRALQFLRAQPEWDGQTLIVRGDSQGGGLTLMAAGLDSQVSLLVAHIAFLCDRVDPPDGLHAGTLTPEALAATRERRLETARYYDAVNFARRTRAAAFLTTGFVDTTCKPSTNYAAFNSLRNPNKAMQDLPNRGHGFFDAPVNVPAMMDEVMHHYLATGQVKSMVVDPADF